MHPGAVKRQREYVDVRFFASQLFRHTPEGEDVASKTNVTMDTRALAAEPLYNAAIGFYPLRGNHDASQTAALELPKFFPQTLGSGSSVF